MGDLSKDIKSKFANNKVKALINILYTANWITNKQNTFFKNYGISPQQYNILRILKGANEPLKVQVVKERMIDHSPNITRLMDKLYAKHFIDRLSCSNDRRVVHAKIKKEGLKLLELIDLDFKDDLLKNLTLKEAKQLSDLLDKIR